VSRPRGARTVSPGGESAPIHPRRPMPRISIIHAQRV
jgi:hypothetical protein